MGKAKSTIKASAKEPAAKKPADRTLRGEERVERIVVNVISVLVFIAFGFVALMSLMQTSVIDPEKYINEHILYEADNLVINIPLMILIFMAVLITRQKFDFFKRVDLIFMEVGLVGYVLILGVFWIVRVQCVPAADSANIFYAAAGAAKGDFTAMQSNSLFYNHDYYGNNSYFMFYPFQLGFVFICEMLYRIFGTDTAIPLEIANVVCVAMSYLAIAKITRILFDRRSIEFVSIVLLLGCFQPILFTAFPYGNVMGMCFALWASFWLIKYMKGSKWTALIPSGVFLVLATLAKYNNMIYLVAFAIVLLLHTIKEKKWQSIAFILAICICSVGASKLIIASYESRSGQKFTSGVSQTLYLEVGMQESYMAPGWYTSIGMRTFMDNGFDRKLANAAAKENISGRLDEFKADIDYATEFFSNKILSQWNEPSYESIWVSKVKSHYNGEVEGFVESVYDKGLSKVLSFWFNLYMQLLFVLFAAGVLMMIAKGRMDMKTVLLPLVLLGGFGYHLLFEGKSQYVLTYIILMIPTASWAAMTLIESKRNPLRAIAASPSAAVEGDGKEINVPQADGEEATKEADE